MENTNQNTIQTQEEKVMYFTADNLSFLDEQSALDHASDLYDYRITTKTQQEVDKAIEEIDKEHWNELAGEDFI